MTATPSRSNFSSLALFAGLMTMGAALFAGVWAYREQTPGAPAEIEPLAQELPPLESGSAPKKPAAKQAAIAKAELDPAFSEEGFIPVATLTDGDPEPVEPLAEEGAATPAPTVVAGLYPDAVAAEASAHICFFSFNNPHEYQRFRKMLDAIAPHTPMKITVQEYVAKDQKIERALRSVIDSGTRCDGVVLSGHHTDEFYGDRSSGDIDTDFFEEMSCNPRYDDWFGQVRALWLAGCKTAQSSLMNKEVDADERISGSPLPWFTARMDLRDVEDSLEEIKDILDENVDEENVVNGYQRAFPAATVFGWSYIAPGEKAGSDRSIPYHIAQLAHILNPDKEIFDVSPITTEFPPRVAQHYAAALYGMLTRPLYNEVEAIPGMTEQNILLAWRRQGDFRYKWALDNPDLRAYGSLLNSNNEVLRQLRGVNCLLQALDEQWIAKPQSAGQVAGYALKQRAILPYATYALTAMLKQSGGRGAIADQMRETPLLAEYLRHAERAAEYRGEDARRLLTALAPPADVVAKPAGESAPAESGAGATVVPMEGVVIADDATPSAAADQEAAMPDLAAPKPSFRTEKIAPVVGGDASQGTESSAE